MKGKRIHGAKSWGISPDSGGATRVQALSLLARGTMGIALSALFAQAAIAQAAPTEAPLVAGNQLPAKKGDPRDLPPLLHWNAKGYSVLAVAETRSDRERPSESDSATGKSSSLLVRLSHTTELANEAYFRIDLQSKFTGSNLDLYSERDFKPNDDRVPAKNSEHLTLGAELGAPLPWLRTRGGGNWDWVWDVSGGISSTTTNGPNGVSLDRIDDNDFVGFVRLGATSGFGHLLGAGGHRGTEIRPSLTYSLSGDDLATLQKRTWDASVSIVHTTFWHDTQGNPTGFAHLVSLDFDGKRTRRDAETAVRTDKEFSAGVTVAAKVRGMGWGQLPGGLMFGVTFERVVSSSTESISTEGEIRNRVTKSVVPRITYARAFWAAHGAFGQDRRGGFEMASKKHHNGFTRRDAIGALGGAALGTAVAAFTPSAEAEVQSRASQKDVDAILARRLYVELTGKSKNGGEVEFDSPFPRLPLISKFATSPAGEAVGLDRSAPVSVAAQFEAPSASARRQFLAAKVKGSRVAVPIQSQPQGFVGNRARTSDRQWQWDAVGAPSVWASGITGQDIRVAVIDLSFEINHPALAPEFGLCGWMPPAESGVAEKVTLGLNALMLPQAGHYHDFENHGTACAGLIGARPIPGSAFQGAAPDCKLGLIAISEQARTQSRVAAAIKYAADSADIIVGSLAFDHEELPSLAADEIGTALTEAARKGILIFWSASNEPGNSSRGVFESHPDVVSVVASGRQFDRDRATGQRIERDVKVYGSQGEKIALTAPGLRLPTTKVIDEGGDGDRDDRYGWFSGCSAAVAVAAGCGALVLQAAQKHLNLRPVDMKQPLTQKERKQLADRVKISLFSTARKVNTDIGVVYSEVRDPELEATFTRNNSYGYGMIDVAAAVAAAAPARVQGA